MACVRAHLESGQPGKLLTLTSNWLALHIFQLVAVCVPHEGYYPDPRLTVGDLDLIKV